MNGHHIEGQWHIVVYRALFADGTSVDSSNARMIYIDHEFVIDHDKIAEGDDEWEVEPSEALMVAAIEGRLYDIFGVVPEAFSYQIATEIGEPHEVLI